MAQWLIASARQLGIRGATLNGAIAGLGHDGVTHAVNLFDLSEQPLQVAFVVDENEAERLFEHLRQASVNIFYVKTSAEFGMFGSATA